MPAGHVDRVWRRRSEWIGERKISEEMTEIVRLGSRSVRDMQFRICHPLMHQNITGFHLDDEQDWVAELECGHNQHVRHRPPWINRPWVMTENGRASMLGHTLQCKLCVFGVLCVCFFFLFFVCVCFFVLCCRCSIINFIGTSARAALFFF